MRYLRFLMLLTTAVAMQAATNWDNSGNGMLKGTYYFRQVYYFIGDQYGDLTEAVALYGNIKFDGNGNYSITTAENARYADTGCGCIGTLTATGTYSIAASGYGFMTSPGFPATSTTSADYIYGSVSASGIFVGSSTDTVNGYNDMFIAAPLASPVPTASSFNGTWNFASFDLSTGDPTTAVSLLFPLNPDGAGNIANSVVTGYRGSGTAQLTQNATGLKYTFSNGAAVITFATNGTLLAGQRYLYFSADGNFVFGGAPNSFDMIVGVKSSAATPNLSGLYYSAGFDETQGYLDSFAGAFNAIGGAAPQSYIGHERVNGFAGSDVYDYTYNDSLSLSSTGTYNSAFTRFLVGAGGAVMISSGIGPSLGLSVGLQAPKPTGTGVFLNPTGVVNAASFAPFTASIAPGELLTLYGSNLAASPVVAGIPFPISLGNVQVSIGGFPAPIFYVSSGQISVIVPYGVQGPIAAITVTNNGTVSNVVTEYVGASAPGVFTQSQSGLGDGMITHLDGTVVTASNPAHMGETLPIYLTGGGVVSPTINDGDPGPPVTLSKVTNTFSVDFRGAQATVTPGFFGLALYFSGLYQMNVTLPATGLTTGNVYLGIAGPDTYMSYKLLNVAASTSTGLNAEARTQAVPSGHQKPVLGDGQIVGRRVMQ